MKVGFIGLGVMGGPMAANILKGGHQLTVYDRSEEAVARLVAAGAKAAASARRRADGAVATISRRARSRRSETRRARPLTLKRTTAPATSSRSPSCREGRRRLTKRNLGR